MVRKRFSELSLFKGRRARARRAELVSRLDIVTCKLEEALRKRSRYQYLKFETDLYADIENKALLLYKMQLVYQQMRHLRPLPAFEAPQTRDEDFKLLNVMDLDSPSSLDAQSTVKCDQYESLEDLKSSIELLERTLNDIQPNLPSQNDILELAVLARSFQYSGVTTAIVKKYCARCSKEKDIAQNLNELIQKLYYLISQATENYGTTLFESIDGWAEPWMQTMLSSKPCM